MKKMLLAVLAFVATVPAYAQSYTNVLPVTINPNNSGDRIKATPVVNPDGTFIGGGGGGGSTPTGSAGSPNANVVTVQGITGATPLIDNLAQVGGAAITLGQKTQANSVPVALASDGTYAKDATLTGGTQLSRAMGVTSGGTQTQVLTDSNGAFVAPTLGTANRFITATSVAANTSTTVCPARASVAAQSIQVSIANVGLGFNGQTLTSAVLGTGTGDANKVLPTALTDYIWPIAPSNAVTAYAASAFIAVCVQETRQ